MMFSRGLLFLLGLSSHLLALHARTIQNSEKPRTCGYAGCPEIHPKKLNVHLVPHTHDDVGWLKTVDQYFYGLQENIQRANVQSIIDTVVQELRKNPERRFIYVETAFLWKWWKLQNEKIQNEVKNFVNEGRLEIISGGWSMNDEATTYYQSIIDQFTWGFRRLNDTFGQCAHPKIGWQIDPFGHSREQGSISAQLGFDAMFIGRLDYQDKGKRLREKNMEFLWQTSPNLGERTDLFTIVLFNNYGPPPGFCFDILCSDPVIIDDPKNYGHNVHEKQLRNINDSWLQMKIFYNYVINQSKYYRTNHIILTMGGDFNYQQAEKYFTNLDKLIRYMTEMHGNEVNVFYSTPSCYLKSVHESEKTWKTKNDDFFPYADDRNFYWTGYFTSRPNLKYFERLGNNFLQIVKQLAVLSKTMDNTDLELFREVMGVMQHHDAITGTEKQHVANDYAKMLYDAIVHGENITSNAISKLLIKNNSSLTKQKFENCLMLNISSCEPTENNENFIVTIYNPTSHQISSHIRLPVQGKSYKVRDYVGNELVTQLIPIPLRVIKIPGRTSKATRELVFRAVEIPPLGYKSFYITKQDGPDIVDEINETESVSSIENNLYDISVNNLGQIVIKLKKLNVQVIQSYHYYDGEKRSRASAAYISRPKASYNFHLHQSYKIYKGPLVQELHLSLGSYMSQIVSIYQNEDHIEFDWVAGPIPVEDGIGREIITRYSSNLASNSTFYTDSNGREMIKRIRNYRPTWDLNSDEPIAQNYYPITTKISLKDDEKQLKMSILTDRSQGATSIQDGQLEVMLHRRLLQDDYLGVDEPLNEMAFGTGLVARGKHYLVVNDLFDLDAIAIKEKVLALSLASKLWIFINPIENININQWKDTYVTQWSGLRKNLPPNVNILTLEPWKDNTILLRLEHLFERDEALELSKHVEIDISNLFTDFDVIEAKETTLGANQWIQDMKRLKWNNIPNRINSNGNNYFNNININNEMINISLESMEIRTFVITTKSITLNEQQNNEKY